MTQEVRRADVALSVAEASTDGRGASLLRPLSTIVAARRMILATVLAALAAAAAYQLLAVPRYDSDVLVQVEERKSRLPGLDDLADALGTQVPAETEIGIVRSRRVLGAVVDELRLDAIAEPRFFPIVGKAIARRRDAATPSEPFLPGGFAWGGERIEVARLEVPKRWEGKSLTVVAREGDEYELLDPSGHLAGRGRAGALLDAGTVRLAVTTLVGRPGTRFTVVRLPRLEVIERLRKKLEIGEAERKTGLIRISLGGPDPIRVAAILDAVARAYVAQNVARRVEEAEKTLHFVREQLPRVRERVAAAETAFNAYRARKGSVDVTLETQEALDRAVELERETGEVQLQVAELRQRFSGDHPVLAAARQRLARLGEQREAIDRRISGLPDAELQSARLVRELSTANSLYTFLNDKAQELEVMRSGAIGNVRVVDPAATPDEPASPKPLPTFGLALLAGSFLGVLLALGRAAFAQGVEDPEAITAETGLPVYASIPHSAPQAKLSRSSRLARHGAGARVPPLAVAAPHEPAVEALRSLRTSVQFALRESGNAVVAFTGPRPGVGKSFVAVNFAHVVADLGKRVLLVDTDLRKPGVHDQLGLVRSPGLSDLIRGTTTEAEAIREGGAPRLAVLPAGERPPNPSELLASSRFEQIVSAAAREYDLVVLDTAPVLAVTDAALAARTAGTILLVLRSGQHPLREIVEALAQLAQGGVHPRAVILNDVVPILAPYTHLHRYRYA